MEQNFKPLIKKIDSHPLKFCFCRSKEEYPILAQLLNDSSYGRVQSIITPYKGVKIVNLRVAKTMYHTVYDKDESLEDDLYLHDRLYTVTEIFSRWDRAGYNKYHAKNPFASSRFMKYLEKSGFYSSDYVIFKF